MQKQVQDLRSGSRMEVGDIRDQRSDDGRRRTDDGWQRLEASEIGALEDRFGIYRRRSRIQGLAFSFELSALSFEHYSSSIEDLSYRTLPDNH
jgi:hypothetical protein